MALRVSVGGSCAVKMIVRNILQDVLRAMILITSHLYIFIALDRGEGGVQLSFALGGEFLAADWLRI
jgi:hypothetical protein